MNITGWLSLGGGQEHMNMSIDVYNPFHPPPKKYYEQLLGWSLSIHLGTIFGRFQEPGSRLVLQAQAGSHSMGDTETAAAPLACGLQGNRDRFAEATRPAAHVSRCLKT